MATAPNGRLLYDGPSMLDGAPVVVIGTGDVRPSDNPKTGAMIQVWVFRKDVNPAEAVATGLDASVCGDCPLRPFTRKTQDAADWTTKEPCYVNVGQAPLSIWKCWQRGGYPVADAAWFSKIKANGRGIRFGAWGDPCAVPVYVWESLANVASKFTGYTHQWRTPQAEVYKPYLMASCETVDDALTAIAQGWRTFRTRASVDMPLMANEINCPASKEAGFKTTCLKCGLCAGASKNAKNIAIVLH